MNCSIGQQMCRPETHKTKQHHITNETKCLKSSVCNDALKHTNGTNDMNPANHETDWAKLDTVRRLHLVKRVVKFTYFSRLSTKPATFTCRRRQFSSTFCTCPRDLFITSNMMYIFHKLALNGNIFVAFA